MEEMRLQKYLALAGIASRRKAEELIVQGLVSVNHVTVTELGTKVSAKDHVEVNGLQVGDRQKKNYIMLNKPQGYVTTVKDQFDRPTVIDLVKEIKERIYPVGRLDYDTTGLLFLSNDGDFANMMMHPKHEIEKKYIAKVMGIPSTEDIETFKKGIDIEGHTTSPAILKILEKQKDTAIVEIVIREGKNRQVRNMCEAIEHPVMSLKRISVGGVSMGDLPEGKWRNLTKSEIRILKKQNHTTEKNIKR